MSTQKYWKAGMLTILLVLPALIILFLHGVTKNHFSLPYLIPIVENGQVKMKGNDTIFYQVPPVVSSPIEVVSFWKESNVHAKQQFTRLQRLLSADLVIRHINSTLTQSVVADKYKVEMWKKGKKEIPYYEQVLLIDKDRYIRGRYDATDPEDIDRLIAEIKILKDIYNKQ